MSWIIDRAATVDMCVIAVLLKYILLCMAVPIGFTTHTRHVNISIRAQ